MPFIRIPQVRQRVAWVATLAVVAVLQLAGCAGHSTQPQANSPTDPVSSYDRSVRIAEKARQNGNFAMAASMFQRAHALSPDKAEPIVALAEMAAASGDLERASALFAEAVRQAPNDAAARRGYGGILLQQNRPADAADQFLAASELEGDDVRSINGLGVSLDLLGEHEEAQRSYLEGLKQAPDNVSLHNNYALSLALSGDKDKAVTLLRQIVADGEAGRRVRQNLALVYALSGRVGDASTVVGRDLSPAEARNNLAFYESLQGLRGRSLAQAVFQAGFGATVTPPKQAKEAKGTDSGVQTAAAPKAKAQPPSPVAPPAPNVPQVLPADPHDAAEGPSPSVASAVVPAEITAAPERPQTGARQIAVAPEKRPGSKPADTSEPAAASDVQMADRAEAEPQRGSASIGRPDPVVVAEPPAAAASETESPSTVASPSFPAVPLPPAGEAAIATAPAVAPPAETTATLELEEAVAPATESPGEPAVPRASGGDPVVAGAATEATADAGTSPPPVAPELRQSSAEGLAGLAQRMLAFFGLRPSATPPAATTRLVALAPPPATSSSPAAASGDSAPADGAEVPRSEVAADGVDTPQLAGPAASDASAPPPPAADVSPSDAGEATSADPPAVSAALPLPEPTLVTSDVEPVLVPVPPVAPGNESGNALGLAELERRLRVYVDRGSDAPAAAITASWRDLEEERQRRLRVLPPDPPIAGTGPERDPAVPMASDPPAMGAVAGLEATEAKPNSATSGPHGPPSVELDAPAARTDPEQDPLGAAAHPLPAEMTAPPPSGTTADASKVPLEKRRGQQAAARVYAIQVASLRSSARAEHLGEQLLARHRDVLTDSRFTLVRANLGERGTFFRVRVGSFDSRAEAADVCSVLSGRKVECLVVVAAS